MPILQHQNYTIEYELTQRRANQKNIILRVNGGRVLVSAPKYATFLQIESTLKKHIPWIIKKLEQEFKTHETIGQLENLQTIDYLGETFKIVTASEMDRMDNQLFSMVNAESPVFISPVENKIYVYTPHGTSKDPSEINVYLHQMIHQKLFHLAKTRIPNHVINLGKSYHLLPKRVIVKEQKSRWGSCSANGSIYMNWRLIQAPRSVLDYVSFHELAHLKEHNHSTKFWNLVEWMMPTYQEHRKWLKENGSRLFILQSFVSK